MLLPRRISVGAANGRPPGYEIWHLIRRCAPPSPIPTCKNMSWGDEGIAPTRSPPVGAMLKPGSRGRAHRHKMATRRGDALIAQNHYF